MMDFLRDAGWGAAVVTPLPGDASTRRYARLSLGRAQGDADGPAAGRGNPDRAAGCQRGRTPRPGLQCGGAAGGGGLRPLRGASAWLRGHGLAAPEIHAADCANGFVILEDLGDALFAEVLADGGDEQALYEAAVEVLAKIHAHDAPAALSADKPLFAYDITALIAETDLLTEWFLPLALGRAATAEEITEHRALWQAALATIGGSRRVFVHRDYHAQNLLWLPERAGIARVGLIDFQDAVAGSAAYDLISLVEDARRDVSLVTAEAATAHYLAAMAKQGTPLDETEFRREMAVMAAQRNAKIVGIFARLYKRDGKPRYLAYLPRVWGYLERDLAHPTLSDMRTWYDRVIPKDKRAVAV